MLGGYQSDFARNLHREGCDFSDLTDEIVHGTLECAGVGAQEVLKRIGTDATGPRLPTMRYEPSLAR